MQTSPSTDPSTHQSTDRLGIQALGLDGVLLLKPKVFGDQRGYFLESFSQERYAAAGLPHFVQDNVSFSRTGCVRGLHFQRAPFAQGKLVTALQGSIFDVVVDLRPHSPTFKQWLSVDLTADNHHQLYVPPGFAHGFCVTSEYALVLYKCTTYYAPEAEAGLRYDDPELAITWPVDEPILSSRDAAWPTLSELGAISSTQGP